MQIKKNDFIEIEFTGKANNEIFDTTNKAEAKSIGIDADVKPVIISVGHEMLLKGLDENLEGKEIGEKYSVHISPDKGFGKRDSKLIKTIPIKIFHEKKMNPYPGLTVQMDNYMAKILSVSGGRVMVDFNNPLAGKDIDYSFKVLRIVEDDKEKINAIQEFFFRQKFDFEIKDKKVIFKEEKMKAFLEIFKNKFKEMTGFEFEVIEIPKIKEEKSNQEKDKKEEPKKEQKIKEESEKTEHVHDPNCNHEH